MRSRQNIRIILFLAASMLLAWQSCKKDEPLPPNPYDSVDYGGGVNPTDTIDPNSIVGLHRNIFSTRCALPACHDGSFEPDFRSIESAFNTLVYHPVIKNDADTSFTYRVLPGDTVFSVLFERITNNNFVNLGDRMPQDNIGVPLSDADIQAIGAWIMNGARDWNGDIPVFPNLAPTVPYFIAIDSLKANPIDFSRDSNRIDSVIINPFYMDSGMQMVVIPFVEDDSTAAIDWTVNKLKFSYNPNDFSSPLLELTATYIDFGGPNQLWYVTVNVGAFTPGSIVYMRYVVNDGDNPDTEFPESESLDFYKTFWSFYIKP